jgi:hypothetical protein
MAVKFASPNLYATIALFLIFALPAKCEIFVLLVTFVVKISLMRGEITDWQKLTSDEKAALTALMGSNAQSIFDNEMIQAGRDTLINMFYLMTSRRVAGNLWRHLSALKWSGRNQVGAEVFDPTLLRIELEASGNFIADSRLTCRLKNSCWSLRQVRIENEYISEHGFQVYRPADLKQPRLLVFDIDTVVFSNLRSWPRHAFDIWRPDPYLNDPLRARSALVARGIFP